MIVTERDWLLVIQEEEAGASWEALPNRSLVTREKVLAEGVDLFGVKDLIGAVHDRLRQRI